jgi:hypothetical protein
MIQIGTADYQGAPISATRSNLGTIYRSEPLITRAAKASLASEPIECFDCGHSINVHASSGCYMTDRDGETLPCLCKLSPDDIGETIESDQEGN